MTHCRKKQDDPGFMAPDRTRLADRFDHQYAIDFRVETGKRQACDVELVAENQNEVAQAIRPCVISRSRDNAPSSI